MKRRSFFGVMGGAAVAGPEMLKQAAAQLSVGGGIGKVSGGYYATKSSLDANIYGGLKDDFDQVAHAKTILGKIVGITEAQRSKARRAMYVDSLDPDLASYRSFSLSAKLEMQKDRKLAARVDEAKTYWERVASGLFGGGEEDDLPI